MKLFAYLALIGAISAVSIRQIETEKADELATGEEPVITDDKKLEEAGADIEGEEVESGEEADTEDIEEESGEELDESDEQPEAGAEGEEQAPEAGLGEGVDQDFMAQEVLKLIDSDKEKQAAIHNFFEGMLRSAHGKEVAKFRCLTVGSYGEQAFMALPFLKPETTCPCLMQRLCYLVAEDLEKQAGAEEGAIEAPEAGAEGEEIPAGAEDEEEEVPAGAEGEEEEVPAGAEDKTEEVPEAGSEHKTEEVPEAGAEDKTEEVKAGAEEKTPEEAGAEQEQDLEEGTDEALAAGTENESEQPKEGEEAAGAENEAEEVPAAGAEGEKTEEATSKAGAHKY